MGSCEIVSAEGLELFEDQNAVSGRSDDVAFTFEDGQLNIGAQRRERVRRLLCGTDPSRVSTTRNALRTAMATHDHRTSTPHTSHSRPDPRPRLADPGSRPKLNASSHLGVHVQSGP